MAENKTQKTDASVEAFLNAIPDETKRADCFALLEMMRELTGDEPHMWGDAIVGFGDWHYKYASGREGDWFKMGFSPRKQAITLYLSTGGLDRHTDLLSKLGKHKTGMGCLYIKKLADVDMQTLKALALRCQEYL